MHKTLERQYRKLKRRFSKPNELLPELLNTVSDSYFSYEKDCQLKSRAIGLMSDEMLELNRADMEKNTAFLSTILESLVDGVVTLTERGEILDMNGPATQIFGSSRSQLIGQPLINFIGGFNVFELLLEDIQTSQHQRSYVNILNKHKKKVPCQISMSSFKRSATPIWILIIRDITQEKEKEQKITNLNSELNNKIAQLQELNNDLESFSYSVSHDLRAPLYFVRNITKVIKEEYIEQFDFRFSKLLGMVSRNIGIMEQLIEDILDFSRTGKGELEKNRFNVNELVSEVIQQLSPGKKYTILAGSLGMAYGDRSLLFQVFLNLLSNAIKYSSKVSSPRIEIGAHYGINEITYFIKDNGDGFSDNEKHKLFEPFQRLHSSDDFQGTGVGLAIVQRIVTRHNGRIWAESKKGQGASFYFTLPVLDENAFALHPVSKRQA